MKQKEQPRRVNYLENPTDLQVLVLARLGQHTRSIAQKTGLSESQVQYRVINGNCKGIRREFRDGQTLEFRWCYDSLGKHIEHKQKEALRRLIKQGLSRVNHIRTV